MPPSLPSDSGGEEPPADDFITPDDEFRPALPLEDRIWRHPSEVAAAMRARPEHAGPTSRPGMRAAGRVSVATIAVSALIGVTLSLGVVAVMGGFEERVVERRIAVDLPSNGGEGARAAVATSTTPSVVGLSVRHGDDWTDINAMVLRSDGALLTTATMLEGSDAVEAHLPGGERLSAEVVGSDMVTDVAVVRIDRGGMTPAVIGSSQDLAVGDEAMAVGLVSSSGWDPMLTTTVIRSLRQRARGPDTSLHDVVVIEAEIAAETAGSPVVDRRGAVVGMVASSGTAATSGGTVVIPIDEAVHVADEILEHGHALHVWLGVGGHDLGHEQAMATGMNGGAAVTAVLPDSPAEQSGLEPGDIISAVDGSQIVSMSDLVVNLRSYEPGDTVELTVTRDGGTSTITVRLVQRD